MKKENEEPCCGNCVSFTNESVYGDGFCCDKEECTDCGKCVININTDNYGNRRKTS